MSLPLAAGISLGLGLPERHFESAAVGGTTAGSSYWVTRVIHYPPLENSGAHTPDAASRALQVRP